MDTATISEGAARLQRLKDETGLSDEAIGLLVGVTGVTVLHWRTGVKVPMYAHRVALQVFTSKVTDPGIPLDGWDATGREAETMLRAVRDDETHAGQSALPRSGVLVAVRRVGGNTSACSGRLFAQALEYAGLSHDAAGRAMGVSRQLVGLKCAGERPVTLSDALALIASGGASLDAVDCLARDLESLVSDRRGETPHPSRMIGRIVLWVGGLCGELCAAASLVSGEPTDEQRTKLLGVCGQIHAQVAQLEACLRGR